MYLVKCLTFGSKTNLNIYLVYHFRVPLKWIEPIRGKLPTSTLLIDLSGQFNLFFRDGKPYCEKDYQADFGVTCAGCGGYIIGKVLQVNKVLLIIIIIIWLWLVADITRTLIG